MSSALIMLFVKNDLTDNEFYLDIHNIIIDIPNSGYIRWVQRVKNKIEPVSGFLWSNTKL